MVKTLSELKLSRRTKEKIRDWLNEWIEHIETNIGKPNTARPRKINFKTWKFFYFTDCSDIINKDPKFENEITNVKMISRKTNIFLELFIRYLLEDEKINPKLHCNHCGGDNCDIRSLRDDKHGKMGHIDICPDCGRTQIVTYPGKYDFVMPIVKDIAYEHGLLMIGNEYLQKSLNMLEKSEKKVKKTH